MPQPIPPQGRLGLTLRPQTSTNGKPIFCVAAVDQGTPAQQSGVFVGDVLVSVDDMEVAGWRFEDVVVLLKGEAGTWAKMRLYRPHYNTYVDLMLQRQGWPGMTYPRLPPPAAQQPPAPTQPPHTNGINHLTQRMGDMKIPGPSPTGSVNMDSTMQSWIQVPHENGQRPPQQHPGIVPARDTVLPTEGGMTGLVNLGNTCFMNSIIQCLVHTLPIATYLIFHMDEDGAGAEQNNKAAKESELVRTFKGLFGHLWSGSHQSPLEPRSLIAAFKTDSRCKSLFNYKQQDAHELLCLLLDAVHQDTNGMVQSERGADHVKRGSSGLMGCFGGARRKPVPAPELEDWVTEIDAEPVGGKPLEADITDVDSVVSKFLAGRLCSEVQCKACGYKTQNRESFFTLSIPLPPRQPNKEVTLQDCFRLLEREEASIPWVCDKCKQSGAAKRIWVYQHPKILIVHLERFGYSNGRKTKRDDCITIPMRGLMREDVPVEAGGVKPPPSYYDMVGWTEHLGSDAEGGHYIAHCKHLDGHFYKFDDARVSRIQYTPYIKSTSAYVLFYERRD